MRLARKRPDRIVPEYSLTGDLLSFRRCARQYRYQNGSALPPSRPVQLWYGEFIHGLLENIYRLWESRGGHLPFPIPYTRLSLDDPIGEPGDGLPEFDLRRLGWPVEESLLNQNKRARSRKARLAAYRRAEAAVNILGPHLFPLIAEAEQRVIGTRNIPAAAPHEHRAEKYALTGVIDVLTEMQLGMTDPNNVIRRAVQEKCLLAPGDGDLIETKAELARGLTDVTPVRDSDRRMLENWRPGARADLSSDFLFARAVRVIPVSDESIVAATGAFDGTVAVIENCVRLEEEAVSILQTWPGDFNDKNTCAACDFRYFCDGYQRTGNQIGSEDTIVDEI